MLRDEPTIRFPLIQNARVFTLPSAALPGANSPGQDMTTYLQHSGEVHALRGGDAQKVIEVVWPWINDIATVDEIVTAATSKSHVSPEWVRQALQWLIESGVCVLDRAEPEDALLRQQYQTQIRHFGQHTSFPTVCQRRVYTSRVGVIGLEFLGSMLLQQLAMAGVGNLRAVGNPDLVAGEAAFLGHAAHATTPTRQALLSAHCKAYGSHTHYETVAVPPGTPFVWEEILEGCDLAVLVLPQWHSSLIRAFNAASLAQDIPFLLLHGDDTASHIGPLVIPHETACLLCVELRRHSRWTREDFRAVQQDYADTQALSWEAPACSIPRASAVAAMAAHEVLTALARYRQPASRGQELSVAAHTWQCQPTPILKVPRCPACSRLAARPSPQPFALQLQKERVDEHHAALAQ